MLPAVELVAQLVQDPDARQDLHLVLVAPHREENVLFRYPEARAHHGLQVGLVAVLAEAGNLARGRHLNAQLDIGTCGHTYVSAPGFACKILTISSTVELPFEHQKCANNFFLRM